MRSSFVCALLSLLASCHGEDAEKNVLVLTADSFKPQLEKDNTFVMFYAPWCGHCKRLHPTWGELADKYAETKDAAIAKVDCTVETSVCSDHDVTGYPTLKFFKKGEEKAEKYRGGRDLAALTNHVSKELGLKTEEIVAEEGSATKGLWTLGENSFANHIKTGDHFIKFYAPWCGHCKKLAPTWDELAEAFADDKVVKIAKIDCTTAGSLCKDNDVKGYPTLAYFRDGKKVETYRGARSINELKDFLKSMQEEGAEKPAAGGDKDKVTKDDAEKKESAVVMLDTETFEDNIKSGLTFVKFFAPWCGHCKRLAPAWDELADKFKDNKDVTIAKVDCTSNDNKNKELCNKKGVNGFPTLKLFKNGEAAEEYNGKRDIAELEKFVTKHAAKQDKDEL